MNESLSLLAIILYTFSSKKKKERNIFIFFPFFLIYISHFFNITVYCPLILFLCAFIFFIALIHFFCRTFVSLLHFFRRIFITMKLLNLHQILHTSLYAWDNIGNIILFSSTHFKSSPRINNVQSSSLCSLT